MAFDYKKEYKEYYMPKRKPEIVDVPPMNYIADSRKKEKTGLFISRVYDNRGRLVCADDAYGVL